ncbi:MAG: hypothetical protein GY817_06735 [bacterium]|nr:hypothetical protein [bacterium]
MEYKYKLKEIEVGDTKVTGGVKSVVTDIDPETGAISWSVDYVPNLSKLVEDSMELATTAKGVYQKAKDDKKFLDIYEQAKQLRNVIRTHVRNNYPEDYKKAIREEEVEEISTSGAAGAYNTPYAFKKKKKKSKYKMKMPSGMVSSLGYTMDEGKLGDGADLGPGPKAGPDGVTDSAYTKQFKYKLVPKNKDGTYVQKGAGMIVKKLY